MSPLGLTTVLAVAYCQPVRFLIVGLVAAGVLALFRRYRPDMLDLCPDA